EPGGGVGGVRAGHRGDRRIRWCRGKHRCRGGRRMKVAILDDYQGVALSSADWSTIESRAEVVAWRDHVDDRDELVRRLSDADVVVLMRERTPVDRQLLEALPALRLLVTTGPSNAVVDVAAAAARGVKVCGTGGYIEPTTELTWAILLFLVRHVPEEVASVRAGRWPSGPTSAERRWGSSASAGSGPGWPGWGRPSACR